MICVCVCARKRHRLGKAQGTLLITLEEDCEGLVGRLANGAAG
jgi:hypothetical protein